MNGQLTLSIQQSNSAMTLYGLKQFIANKGDLFEDDLVVLYSPKIDSMRCFDTSEHLVGIRKFVEFLDDVVVKEGKENGKSKD